MRERRGERGARRLMLSGALALGLVAGGGVAWAFWTTQATAEGDSVTSATMDLLVNGQAVGAGQGYTLTGLQPPTGFYPGTSAATTLTLSNGGTSSIILTSGTITLAGGPAAQYSRTIVWGVAATGTTCPAGPTTPPTTVLAPGASMTVCVSVALSATAPDTQNQSTTATVTFQAQQVDP